MFAIFLFIQFIWFLSWKINEKKAYKQRRLETKMSWQVFKWHKTNRKEDLLRAFAEQSDEVKRVYNEAYADRLSKLISESDHVLRNKITLIDLENEVAIMDYKKLLGKDDE